MVWFFGLFGGQVRPGRRSGYPFSGLLAGGWAWAHKGGREGCAGARACVAAANGACARVPRPPASSEVLAHGAFTARQQCFNSGGWGCAGAGPIRGGPFIGALQEAFTPARLLTTNLLPRAGRRTYAPAVRRERGSYRAQTYVYRLLRKLFFMSFNSGCSFFPPIRNARLVARMSMIIKCSSRDTMGL